MKKYRAVVIGASAGGIDAIKTILEKLSEKFAAPIIIVQHLSPRSSSYIIKYIDGVCNIRVKEADEKEKILCGNAYIAPSNYHILIEKDETVSFTLDPKVNYSRPSIDMLFYSAAEVYRDELIGIILTGANKDGSMGLKRIQELGGLTIVQDPNTAEAEFMPSTAIKITNVDYILSLDEITNKLIKLVGDLND